MNERDFAVWNTLAKALLDREQGRPTDPKAVESNYAQCLVYLDRDKESDLIVNADNAKHPSKLTVSFRSYGVTHSLDNLIALISFERAREVSDERLLNDLVHTHIRRCSKELGEYVTSLSGVNATLAEICENLEIEAEVAAREKELAGNVPKKTSASSKTKGSKSAPQAPEPPVRRPESHLLIDRTAIQLVILEAGAKYLAEPPLRSELIAVADTSVATVDVLPDAEPTPGTAPRAKRSRKSVPAAPASVTPSASSVASPPVAALALATPPSASAPPVSTPALPPPTPATPPAGAAATAPGSAPSLPAQAPAAATGLAPQEKVSATRAEELRTPAEARSHAAALRMVINHVAEASQKLVGLQEKLERDSLRKALNDYLSPMAKYFDAGGHVRRLARWYVLYLLAGITGFIACIANANAYSAYGTPVAFGLVGAAIAAGFGLAFSLDPISRIKTRRQKDRLRTYVEGILGDSRSKAADALEVLGAEVSVGVRRVTIADRVARTLSGVRDKIVALPVGLWRRLRRRVLLWWGFKPESDPAFRFRGVGRVQAGGWRLPVLAVGVAALSFGISALPSLVPTHAAALAPSIFASVLQNYRPQPLSAQALRVVVGREVCEIARGTVAWQDDNHIYIRPIDDGGGATSNLSLVAVSRSDATELRFGNLLKAVTPCTTLAPEDRQITINAPLTIVEKPTDTDIVEARVEFHSTVVIDGTTMIVRPPVGSWRYVILPLSAAPVEGFDYSTLTPPQYLPQIYDFYFDGLAGLAVDDEVASQVRPIRAALEEAAARGKCEIEIDVLGYASLKPFVLDDLRSNYVLAEGRRAAVLLALGFEANEEQTANGLRLAQGYSKKPTDLTFLRWKPKFGRYEDMRDNLLSWYSEPAQGKPTGLAAEGEVAETPSEQLRESIARSAVIAISEDDLASCNAEKQFAGVGKVGWLG